jgi:predicted permease
MGAGVALLGIEVPAILDGIMKLVRGATVPCALFALGATLAGLPLAERLRETVFMVALKLVAYPAAVYLTMLVLLPDLDPVWRAVAVISAAVPIGANVYLVADRYEAYVQRASTAILASTVLSVVTVSALVVALG